MRLRDLHEKFDTLSDPNLMADKLKSTWFNLDRTQTTLDIQYSEDFSDPEDQLFYKRYKL